MTHHRLRIILICILLLMAVPVLAQDNPYNIILQHRIEAARDNEVRILDFSRIGLTELPPEIGQLHNLRVLSLNRNQLSNLPSEIGQLQNLKQLEFIGNQLTDLPPEIGQLQYLQVLRLDYNQLGHLPPEIGHLTNLCHLHITYNNLRQLPKELGQLTRLTQSEACFGHPAGLYLNGNPLISPPPEVVEQGTKAVLAYLRHQAWYHLQRLIIGSASGVGVLALGLLLGLRYRQQRRKPKQKRSEISA